MLFHFLISQLGFCHSLFNPIIYSVRFRLAAIELTCITVKIAEAEEIEIRLFGAPDSKRSTFNTITHHDHIIAMSTMRKNPSQEHFQQVKNEERENVKNQRETKD